MHILGKYLEQQLIQISECKCVTHFPQYWESVAEKASPTSAVISET